MHGTTVGWLRPWVAMSSVLVAAVVGGGCGSDDEAGGGGGDVPWSTSAFGASTVATGSGGAGAGGSATSGGGAGGATTSGSGSGGGGASGPATALVLGAGPSAALGARFDGSDWSSTTFGETSDLRPGVSFLGVDRGLFVLRAASAPHRLRFTTWSADGGFEAWSDISATATTRDRPVLVGASLAYQGSDFKHYYALFGASWMPTGEPIGPSQPLQSFGPAAGHGTTLGGDFVFAFPGDDGGVYVQSRSGGTWAAATGIPGAQTDVTPAIVALTSGPELLAVWVNDEPGQFDDQKVFFATRSGGVWSTPAKIDDGVFAVEAPTLAALAGGQAVLAFRGTDDKPYALRFDGTSWSAVGPVGSPNNPTIASPPVLAPGAPGADAELVYVSGGAAIHVRLTAGGWSSPVTIGGAGLTHAAITTEP